MGSEQRTIRPADAGVPKDATLYGAYTSADACRLLMHMVFRDARTVIDLTYAHSGFWQEPLPPGIHLTTNDMNPTADTDEHEDFTATRFEDSAFHVAVYDPPHIADGGKDSIMARRFGTIKSTAALKQMIQDGAREAWRISSVGVLVKVAEHSHGGEFLRMTRWIEDVMPVAPYAVMHSYRRPLIDPKHKVQRVPRNNGATYLTFRADGHRHQNFDAMYARQEQ